MAFLCDREMGFSPCRHRLPKRSKGHSKRSSWLHTVTMVMILGLSLTGVIQKGEGGQHPGFDQDCSGFDQDLRLVDLWHAPTKGAIRNAVSVSLVPRVSLRGTALATYAERGERTPSSTIEALFGVSQDGQRQVVETPFYQEAHGVVLYPHVLATVAHALTPDSVDVSIESQRIVRTVPLRVTRMHIAARMTSGGEEVALYAAHINEPYDLALAQTGDNAALPPFPYPTALSYGTGEATKPIGGLQAGDCVAALVTSRPDERRDPAGSQLIVGKVLAKVPVATNAMTQTKLNVNMFTTDLAVQPGDSGSPVLALRAGQPTLVGLVSATMYPTALFTYVSRIDPLLALAEALRLAGPRQPQKALAYRTDQALPEGK